MTTPDTHEVVVVESETKFTAACTSCRKRYAEGEGRFAVAIKQNGNLLGVCVDDQRTCHGVVPIIAAYNVRSDAIQKMGEIARRIEQAGTVEKIKTHPFAEQPREVRLVFA